MPALNAFIAVTQERVNGSVELELYKGGQDAWKVVPGCGIL